MATVYLQGPVMFARVFEHNKDEGQYAPEEGQYVIDIGLDKTDAKKVKSWNKLYTPKEYPEEYQDGVDESKSYFKFKRKHKHLSRKGKLIKAWSGPPKVVFKDMDFEDTDAFPTIGNGSICTIKLNVETAQGRNGPMTFVRLEGVRVDELVVFEPEEPEEEEQNNETLNDEIPF